MVSIRAIVVMFAALLGLAVAAPGGYGGYHKHVKIIVPYKVHTVHHHHVEKVHVPVHIPVVKKVFIPYETHHNHHDDWHGGWW